jgi:hypothetical protein
MRFREEPLMKLQSVLPCGGHHNVGTAVQAAATNTNGLPHVVHVLDQQVSRIASRFSIYYTPMRVPVVTISGTLHSIWGDLS